MWQNFFVVLIKFVHKLLLLFDFAKSSYAMGDPFVHIKFLNPEAFCSLKSYHVIHVSKYLNVLCFALGFYRNDVKGSI